MLFPSFTFVLAFLPVTLIVYFLLGKKSGTWARVWLLCASLVFYSWFNHSYFFIIAGSIVGNYLLSQWLWKKPSKFVFTLGALLNIALLGYFKYYDFMVENVNAFFGTSLILKKILLPLGISFFTFQQISYLHSVCSRSLKERYSFLTYALFVTFFPQLIAGPIVLPDEMMPQFDRKDSLKVNYDNLARGIFAFALGLGSKMLLADYFAEIADAGFASGCKGFLPAWKTALAYTFQIFFDFGGYCDMAYGVALMFNIRLPQNFDAPYRSASISEFWRRWHMTLGRFLSTYIYIPLGGSRKGHFRTCLNLLITFFVSGLWHGASWLFVLWGGLHGLASVIQRCWQKWSSVRLPKIAGQLLTFVFVVIAWVLFRAENMAQARGVYQGMFIPQNAGFEVLKIAKDWVLFLIGGSIVLFVPPVYALAEKFRPYWWNAVLTIGILTASIFCFVKSSPFIYFNF